MSIEGDVKDAIQARVSGRAYVGRFAQPERRPEWPAARVSRVSAAPPVDICGDSGEEAADFRIQIDLAVAEGEGYDALSTLKSLVMQDMAAFTPPAIWDGDFYTFDEPTRTHRFAMDYLIYPSSVAESP